TYAAEKSRLEKFENLRFVEADISNKRKMEKLFEEENFSYVVNFAAESHVDNSIESGKPFVRSNVEGAYTLMDVASQRDELEKFIQISTDEVYGSVEKEKAKEGDTLKPSSPYSASKASADMLANSFKVTHNLPVIIARPTNNFGPNQHKEKLIPKFINRARKGKKLPVYGDGTNVRDWLYVKDNCRAIETLLKKGEPGEIYNIGANQFRENIEVTKKILDLLGKDESLIEYVEDRKGHDQRYAVDSSKIRDLGWEPKVEFEKGLKKTIKHYSK
ncbi:MAG: dTDP-glucose 4,6-dehydratase, partial [Candidatus Nanohaloarchaea archaeon]